MQITVQRETTIIRRAKRKGWMPSLAPSAWSRPRRPSLIEQVEVLPFILRRRLWVDEGEVIPPGPPTPPLPTRPGRSGPLVPRDPRAANKRSREHTEVVASILNSLTGGGYIQMVGPAEYAIMGGSFVEDRPPLNIDDSTIGANVGVLWIDTSASPRTVYICTDNSVGAAVWKLLP